MFDLLKIDKLIIPLYIRNDCKAKANIRDQKNIRKSKHPALEIEEFLLVTETFQHDISLFSYPLHLWKSCLKFKNAQVMQATYQYKQVKLVVLKGILILTLWMKIDSVISSFTFAMLCLDISKPTALSPGKSNFNS